MFERLADADRQYIKSQVDNGIFASEIEVVRDAIRQRRENDERQMLEKLRGLVLVGHEQAIKGETVAYSEGLLNDILKAAIQDHEEGTPIKHEVKP